MWRVPSETNVTMTSPPIREPRKADLAYLSSDDMLMLMSVTVPMKIAVWKTYQKRMSAAAGQCRRQNGHVAFSFIRIRDLQDGEIEAVKPRTCRRPSLNRDIAISSVIDAGLIGKAELLTNDSADDTGLDQIGLDRIGMGRNAAGVGDNGGRDNAHGVTSIATNAHIAPNVTSVKHAADK